MILSSLSIGGWGLLVGSYMKITGCGHGGLATVDEDLLLHCLVVSVTHWIKRIICQLAVSAKQYSQGVSPVPFRPTLSVRSMLKGVQDLWHIFCNELSESVLSIVAGIGEGDCQELHYFCGSLDTSCQLLGHLVLGHCEGGQQQGGDCGVSSAGNLGFSFSWRFL